MALPGGRLFTDDDYYIYRLPMTPAGIYESGRVEIRQPYNPSFPLTVEGAPGTLIATNATEMVREYRIPRLFNGATNFFHLRAGDLSDSAYKIRFYPARWVANGLPPDRFDQPNGNPPFSDNNQMPHRVPPGQQRDPLGSLPRAALEGACSPRRGW